jgi:formylglycine-generating enzyme required for sulfatase activity
MQSKWVKGVLTVVGAIGFSTLGIFAADSLQGIDGGIGQIAGVGGKEGVCIEGAVPLTVDGRVLCADMYEASPSQKCPHQTLANTMQTEENTTASECYAASVPGAVPWNYVTLPQAQRICANAGKRLPTSKEWYQIVLGTTPDVCTIRESAVSKTGNTSCISTAGAYDAVGNVWEWVNEEVVGNTFNGRQLPEEGYVASVDSQGIAITSSQTADDLYGKDYVWTKGDGVFGMLRGGFYGSNQDAGLYTVNASVPTNFATQGVGFRCVKDTF